MPAGVLRVGLLKTPYQCPFPFAASLPSVWAPETSLQSSGRCGLYAGRYPIQLTVCGFSHPLPSAFYLLNMPGIFLVAGFFLNLPVVDSYLLLSFYYPLLGPGKAEGC